MQALPEMLGEAGAAVPVIGGPGYTRRQPRIDLKDFKQPLGIIGHQRPLARFDDLGKHDLMVIHMLSQTGTPGVEKRDLFLMRAMQQGPHSRMGDHDLRGFEGSDHFVVRKKGDRRTTFGGVV